MIDVGGCMCSKVFFFKQKTAYEMLRGLVGSEMCIRDRFIKAPNEPLAITGGILSM